MLVIFSGIYNVVEAFRGDEHGRVWRGIAGVVFIVAGLVLIRHLHLSLALIGLVIGLTWVVQGLAALIAGVSGGATRMGTGWAIFFGVISLIAGIVVISAPIASITTLAVLMGIWFVVMGVMEMFGAFAFRHAVRSTAPTSSTRWRETSASPASGRAAAAARLDRGLDRDGAEGDRVTEREAGHRRWLPWLLVPVAAGAALAGCTSSGSSSSNGNAAPRLVRPSAARSPRSPTTCCRRS